MSLLYLLSLLLLFSFQLFLSWNIVAAFETQSIGFSSDSWCTQQCDSHSTCLERFGHNYVDLQLQLRFNQTILQRYGQTLEYGIYLGETISQQSFETQFIVDISSALKHSPCRMYVIQIEPLYHDEDKKEENVYTLLLVSFRWISVDIEAIRILTRLVQEPESSIYQGQVCILKSCLYEKGRMPNTQRLSLRPWFSFYIRFLDMWMRGWAWSLSSGISH
jgi:hypothetical protein